MRKTNTGLVEYVKAQVGRPYWYGTIGTKATEKLWAEKSKQYGRFYSDKRRSTMLHRGDLGQKVHDCSGLTKGYLMSEGVDAEPVYNSKYDLSADDFYNKAKKKGKIDTIPEVAGLGLHKKGHMGVYIGNGKEVEARGFDYGVLVDDLKNAGFTEWFEIPFIEYEQAQAPQNDPVKPMKSVEEIVDEVIAGKWGNDPERAERLKAAGYNRDEIQAAVNARLGVGNKPSGTFTGVVATQKDNLRVRAGAGTQYGIVKLLAKGAKITFDREQNGWYHLSDGSGWVSANYIRKC